MQQLRGSLHTLLKGIQSSKPRLEEIVTKSPIENRLFVGGTTHDEQAPGMEIFIHQSLRSQQLNGDEGEVYQPFHGSHVYCLGCIKKYSKMTFTLYPYHLLYFSALIVRGITSSTHDLPSTDVTRTLVRHVDNPCCWNGPADGDETPSYPLEKTWGNGAYGYPQFYRNIPRRSGRKTCWMMSIVVSWV